MKIYLPAFDSATFVDVFDVMKTRGGATVPTEHAAWQTELVPARSSQCRRTAQRPLREVSLAAATGVRA